MAVKPRCSEHESSPAPPFTDGTAIQKAWAAEGARNKRDPARVVLVFTPDSYWRNRGRVSERPFGLLEIDCTSLVLTV